MNDIFSEDFKEPKRPSAWVAVLVALSILFAAYFVWYTGVERIAEGVNDFLINFEQEYDGVKNG